MPWRQKILRPLKRRAQLIGLLVAGLLTAAVLIGLFTGILSFAAVAGIGVVALALLIAGDLRDGNHVRERGRLTRQPKIAQVKRNHKPPASRL